MRGRIVVGLIASIYPGSVAFADFPSHADICVNKTIKAKAVSIVSKEKLAKAILKQNPDWTKLYIDASDSASEPKFAPQWRRIFTDPKFCINDPGCLAQPAGKAIQSGTKPPPPDNSAAIKTRERLRFELANAIQTDTDGRYYSSTNPSIGTDYLLGDDTVNPIRCVGPELLAAPKPTILKLPIRLRANSDDLYIDAGRDADLFKTVSPATVSFSRDGIQKTDTTKLQAALGYAIPLPIDVDKSKALDYFNGELVPYISANESITKVDGKVPTFADTNSVAVGALLNTQTVFSSFSGVNNVFIVKPQYLWDTKDQSEIASLKLIYKPWTFVTNTPIQVGTFLDATWVTLVFDLRNDAGEYTRKGTGPVAALTHTSFDRAGSNFGFAVATANTGPHLVLNVTETMLYGFAGSFRQLNQFNSNLSYYFDSTSNFAFTVTYTKGQDEYTAVSAQTVTAGLSAKF